MGSQSSKAPRGDVTAEEAAGASPAKANGQENGHVRTPSLQKAIAGFPILFQVRFVYPASQPPEPEVGAYTPKP
ncbi:mCG12234, isoform CRA_a [Mus musculus]|nr:mCG12234, isoform CRA_a [Mus musculus]